jgi:dipeptidyl aminopeptidase/acylaminoacyl peptidase
MESLDAADVLAGVDWLVARGAADEQRLGLRGHSYGAGLGAWLLGHTRRFRAAVLDGAGAHHPDTFTVSTGAQTPTLLLQGS